MLAIGMKWALAADRKIVNVNFLDAKRLWNTFKNNTAFGHDRMHHRYGFAMNMPSGASRTLSGSGIVKNIFRICLGAVASMFRKVLSSQQPTAHFAWVTDTMQHQIDFSSFFD